jgi:Na+-transporting methylmalonyl-CoA/oxaloacetate decarboxylase beta subunit
MELEPFITSPDDELGLLVPEATPLISMLMLGNLLKVSGVVKRLSKAAENEISSIATLFLELARPCRPPGCCSGS